MAPSTFTPVILCASATHDDVEGVELSRGHQRRAPRSCNDRSMRHARRAVEHRAASTTEERYVHDDIVECIIGKIDDTWQLVPLRGISSRWRACIDRALWSNLVVYLTAMRIRYVQGTPPFPTVIRYARSLCMERYRNTYTQPPRRYRCICCGRRKSEIGCDACCRRRRAQHLCAAIVLFVVALFLNIRTAWELNHLYRARATRRQNSSVV